MSLAAELPSRLVEVWLTDRAPEALDVARANTAGLGMAGECVRFGLGSWFGALPERLRGELALVVSKKYGIELRADDQNNMQIFASIRALADHVDKHRATPQAA